MPSNKKLTIEEMQKIAESKGGKCLSEKYVNANTKLKWQCKHGHIWFAVSNDIKNKNIWCPHCSHRARLTIEEMQKLAKSKGGRCLSKEYINNTTKLDWCCKNGHVWTASAHEVKANHWCPKCANEINAARQKLRRLTIEEMQKLAEAKGGKCLSENYINSNTKLKWQCKNGHIWYSIPSSVKIGKWCLKCAGKIKFTLEEMQKLAESKGGKCLSTNYINVDTKLEWRCKEGHVWKTTPYSIKKGTWCPKCGNKIGGLKQRLTIEEMQELAKAKGGKCLSVEYVGANSNLEWQCREGHVWESRPHRIKLGQWCPICSQGIGERTCHKYFEIMFGKKFRQVRPRWLTTPQGTKLELDGYCEELKMAFEYQGQQHYEHHKFFNRTMSFEKRKEYDELKKKLCESRGVTLVTIPFNIKPEKMGEYIIQQCEKHGIKVPNKEVLLKSFTFCYPEIIDELQEIARSRGGKLLSETYLGSNKKLDWICKEGHVWKAIPNSIKNGRWCRKCSYPRAKKL